MHSDINLGPHSDISRFGSCFFLSTPLFCTQGVLFYITSFCHSPKNNYKFACRNDQAEMDSDVENHDGDWYS